MRSSVRQAFEQFSRLQIDSEELAAATGMVWKFESSTGNVEILRPVEVSPPVEVSTDDVARALEKHRRGGLSDSEIQEWANLIILCDSYELSSRHIEPLTSVLHQLASPELFGDLTPDVTDSLRRGLERTARSGE
jgi:hypothetical protein